MVSFARRRVSSFCPIVLDAEKLQYRDIVFENLRIDDVRTPDQVAGVQLEVTGVQVGDREFSELTAQLSATTDRQSLAVSGAYLDSECVDCHWKALWRTGTIPWVPVGVA